MKLEDVVDDALGRETAGELFSQRYACCFQPDSYCDFGRFGEIEEIWRGWTHKNPRMGFDVARLWSLFLNINALLPDNPGNLAELGVAQGNSAALLNFFSKKYGRKLYLLDTFSGFPESELDEPENAARRIAYSDASLEGVQQLLGYNPLLRFKVGRFPESIDAELEQDRFSVVSLDADNYKPIYSGLEFFYPRMVPGGYVFIHDFSSGHWPGVAAAVRDYFGQPGPRSSFLLPDKAGTLVLQKLG